MDINRTAADTFFTGQGISSEIPSPIVAIGYAPASLQKGVRVKAHSDNESVIYVGMVNKQDYPLAPGQSVDIEISDVHLVWVVGIGSYSWIAG
jgi:hypothetical protein